MEGADPHRRVARSIRRALPRSKCAASLVYVFVCALLKLWSGCARIGLRHAEVGPRDLGESLCLQGRCGASTEFTPYPKMKTLGNSVTLVETL